MSPAQDATVAIAGAGAVTPVGLSAPATCAALRAGVARMRMLEGWTDGGELPDPPFAAGRVPLEWLLPDYPYEWPGHEALGAAPPQPELYVSAGAERLVELALPAAEEAWTRAGFAGQSAPGIGLYLGLDDADDGKPIAQAIAGALGIRFELQRQDCLGRAASLAALHRAVRHLREGRVQTALVGGVDSLLRRARVAQLLEQGRLKHDDQPQGVVPGEAAAFVVLSATPGRGSVTIEHTALAEEETARTGEPCRGVGLTQVLRGAAGALGEYPLVVCDLNGERYRHIEWGLASMRALGRLEKRAGGTVESDLLHAADCIGDTGAASGVLGVIWAAAALRGGWARTQLALVWGASDGVLRAAATLARRKRT